MLVYLRISRIILVIVYVYYSITRAYNSDATDRNVTGSNKFSHTVTNIMFTDLIIIRTNNILINSTSLLLIKKIIYLKNFF